MSVLRRLARVVAHGDALEAGVRQRVVAAGAGALPGAGPHEDLHGVGWIGGLRSDRRAQRDDVRVAEGASPAASQVHFEDSGPRPDLQFIGVDEVPADLLVAGIPSASASGRTWASKAHVGVEGAQQAAAASVTTSAAAVAKERPAMSMFVARA